MKTKFLILFLVIVAATGLACNSQNQFGNNSALNHNSHAGTNHNTATTATAANVPMNHQDMNHGSAMNHSEMQSSPGAASAPYDLQFLDTMIAHHQGAVEMSKPVEAKAGRAELKTLAKNIIADQEKEIAQMKKWREEWFAALPPAINMEMAGMQDSMKGMDMKKLESLKGNEFDLEFINQMTPHHGGAVIMAKEALRKSQKEEIKTLANAIIKAQEAEIKQMKDWQASWSKEKSQ
ncbi:MAG TPA: DUF305 domain-containing protein [Pyrinomonadaceae bacterium]|jgi:uncharacterized protein (DUF305 family)